MIPLDFRAFIDGKMHFSEDGTLEKFFAIHEDLGYDQDKSVIMQFTTFRDKAGKKIYCDDFVEDEDGDNYFVDFRHGSYVGVHPPSCMSERDGSQECSLDNLNDLIKEYSLEIIGNKHENPEILEQ